MYIFCINIEIHNALSVHIDIYPPKNEDIALWPNTRVVKCKYHVSQKQNGFNNKIQLYSILATFILKFNMY